MADLSPGVQRTAGIPVIATLVFGVLFILVVMQQGQDLVRGVAEDGPGQEGAKSVQFFFALGLLFLALQAWSWSRFVIESNYGVDRSKWRPKEFLVWTPRVLGAIPFVAVIWSLGLNPGQNYASLWLLVFIGAAFFVFVVARQRLPQVLPDRMKPGQHTAAVIFGRFWVILGLVGAAAVMILAVVWPIEFGLALGAPAVVFFGLGFIIPVIVTACQTGDDLKIPVVGALLGLAVLLAVFTDNHQVGRRAFAVFAGGGAKAADTSGAGAMTPDERLTLQQAFEAWKAATPGDRRWKSERWR